MFYSECGTIEDELFPDDHEKYVSLLEPQVKAEKYASVTKTNNLNSLKPEFIMPNFKQA